MHTVVLPVVRGAAPPRRLAPARAGLGCDQPPTYLRAIVTARCPLSCTYCHMEGDPAGATAQGGLPREELVQLLRVGVESGVRKLKLLGGDPLARADLPEIVQAVRATSADLDISVITAGVFRPERVDALYAAGLSRCNVSIHGWTPEAFALRVRGPSHLRLHALRADFIERVREHGKPLKLNYVVSADTDLADLAALLDWAAGKPRILVNTLDNLHEEGGMARLRATLVDLRGEPVRVEEVPDPDSLPTLHLTWRDGLVVELKHTQLGRVGPWRACARCHLRDRCREGIHAVRLSHQGVLRPCMDRSDLGLDLVAILRERGFAAAAAAWREAFRGDRGGAS